MMSHRPLASEALPKFLQQESGEIGASNRLFHKNSYENRCVPKCSEMLRNAPKCSQMSTSSFHTIFYERAYLQSRFPRILFARISEALRKHFSGFAWQIKLNFEFCTKFCLQNLFDIAISRRLDMSARRCAGGRRMPAGRSPKRIRRAWQRYSPPGMLRHDAFLQAFWDEDANKYEYDIEQTGSGSSMQWWHNDEAVIGGESEDRVTLSACPVGQSNTYSNVTTTHAQLGVFYY